MEIKTTINRLIDKPGSSLKAIASVTLGNAFAVHGIRVMDSEKGLYLLMPSTEYKGRYDDIFHAVTKEARQALNDAVLDAYETQLAQEQTQAAPEQQQGPAMSM